MRCSRKFMVIASMVSAAFVAGPASAQDYYQAGDTMNSSPLNCPGNMCKLVLSAPSNKRLIITSIAAKVTNCTDYIILSHNFQSYPIPKLAGDGKYMIQAQIEYNVAAGGTFTIQVPVPPPCMGGNLPVWATVVGRLVDQ